MTERSLPQKIIALTEALTDAGISHAFGGAIALAYYAEPRGTVDIDLNVFVAPDRYPELVEPLTALGVAAGERSVAEAIGRAGQARAMWDGTPVDLFLAYDRFHNAAATAVRTVPFADGTIPVLAVEHLLVCKVVFNRAKDWVDIDAVLDAGTGVDGAEVLRWVGRIVGDDDARYNRIAAVLM